MHDGHDTHDGPNGPPVEVLRWSIALEYCEPVARFYFSLFFEITENFIVSLQFKTIVSWKK
jgi:hypothetical protein